MAHIEPRLVRLTRRAGLYQYPVARLDLVGMVSGPVALAPDVAHFYAPNVGSLAVLYDIAKRWGADLYDFHLSPCPIVPSGLYENDFATLYDFRGLDGANQELAASWGHPL